MYYCTEELNQLWQDKLENIGSVFANYKLVGSQWFILNDEPKRNLVPAPFYLANTTAETYIQPKGSCISCHNDAKIKKSKGSKSDEYIKTDLSFVLAGAREE